MSQRDPTGREHADALQVILKHGSDVSRRDDVRRAMGVCSRCVAQGVPVTYSGGAWGVFVTHSWSGIPGISELFAQYLRPGYIDISSPHLGALRLQNAITLEHPLAFAAMLRAGADERLVPTEDSKVSVPGPDTEPVAIRDIEHMIELEVCNQGIAQHMQAVLRLHRLEQRIQGRGQGQGNVDGNGNVKVIVNSKDTSDSSNAPARRVRSAL